mmetsp:Transcript_83973/g.151522  ORF Transcript_83973/g.151522 Transcript_83973/m.151522 type:complete len:597 (-) Transcript_83973:28-1818(-)
MRETDAALHAKVDGGECPGVISVVFRRGELAHLDCYGYADLERKVPMRPDTIVRLYSMTKCMISVAAAMCIEENLLRLDDPVAKFIPAFANVEVKTEAGDLVSLERPMTVLHLLTHTSGLGYGPMLGDDPDGETEERFVPLIERAGLARTGPGDARAVTTLEQWCDELAKIPLRSQPGAEWFYSYSHDVAGRVIEVATGQRLDAFLQKRLLGPLGLVDTGFEIPCEKWGRTAGMYRRNEVTPPEEQTSVITETDSAACAPLQSQGEGAEPLPEAQETAAEEKAPVYELARIDSADLETNEWLAGNACPILSGGGSVDAMTGGLVSTAADYSRFCLMLLRKGELDGVRVLKPETVEMMCANHLPAATGKDDVWAFSTPGVGFSLVGSVSVEHPDLDEGLQPGEYGWGGMAGTAWTNDPREDFCLLSFSLVAFDLTTEEVLREGVRSAIARFDQRKEQSLKSRLERAARLERRQKKQQHLKPKQPQQPQQKEPPSPQKLRSPAKKRSASAAKQSIQLSTPPAKTPPAKRKRTPGSPTEGASSLASKKGRSELEVEISPKLLSALGRGVIPDSPPRRAGAAEAVFTAPAAGRKSVSPMR